MKYEKHDVGKILGVLFIGLGLEHLAGELLDSLVEGGRLLDLSSIPALLGVALGYELYEHGKWGRVGTIVLSTLLVALFFVGAVLAMASPAEENATGHTVESIGPVKTLVFHGFWAAVCCMPIYFLNTEKAKSEFGVLKRPQQEDADAGP